MEKQQRWIVTRVDGKISSVSTDWRSASRVLAALAADKSAVVEEVVSNKISTEEVFELSDNLLWEDLRLFGSEFQISVWKELFSLTHGEGAAPRLLSYSDLADRLGKLQGVRAVAHAVGLNPCAVVIPCHLIIPKESIERLHDLEEENSLFKWQTLYMVDKYVDYGEYALGAGLKRRLIQMHLNR